MPKKHQTANLKIVEGAGSRLGGRPGLDPLLPSVMRGERRELEGRGHEKTCSEKFFRGKNRAGAC